MDKNNKSNLNNFPKTDNSTSQPKKFGKEVLKSKYGGFYTPFDIIKILLRERAMKQTDLADKIGLSKQALHNYISGRFACPTQIKIKISQALEVDSSVIWDLEAKK